MHRHHRRWWQCQFARFSELMLAAVSVFAESVKLNAYTKVVLARVHQLAALPPRWRHSARAECPPVLFSL